MRAEVRTVSSLRASHADEIVRWLTHPGSEFQEEILKRHEATSDTPVAFLEDSAGVVAWAATHRWQGFQTLEGFTRHSSRRRGFATTAASLLVAVGAVDPGEPVAVFDGSFVHVARKAGCADIVLFERRGCDWVRVS